MKRFLLIAGIILAVLSVFVGVVWLRLRADRPDRLIARLASARGGERQEIIRLLSVARGDVMTQLLDAFTKEKDASFRAEILDQLFKRNLREPDERAAAVFKNALTDKAPEIRRQAAGGLVTYGDEKAQRALAICVKDTDPEVRRQAYALFAGCNNRGGGSYDQLSPDERSNLVSMCVTNMKTEPDPEIAFLARGVVGLEISKRCDDAVQAVASADVAKAKALIESALALDPENMQAQVRLSRLYLATGDQQAALATARKYKALIEIPHLSRAPVIDGDPTDDVWREAFTTERFFSSTSTCVAKPAGAKSKCYIGHYNGRIYVAMLGFEDDLNKLVVTKKNRDDDVYRDDCVELMFNPENSEKDFCQFDINPMGTLLDLRNGRFDENFRCDHKAGVFKDRGYWAVEFAIDASQITKVPVNANTVWSLDFFRTRIGGGSETDAIWPTYGGSLRVGLYPLAVFKD